MSDKSADDRFSWRLTFYVVGGGLLAVLLILLCDSFDIIEMFYLFAGIPLVCLILLGVAIVYAVRKKQRKVLSIVLAMLVYGGSSWLLLKSSTDIRATEKWLFHSRTYKAEVLSQPNPQDGTLRHMEWDGWGFAGSDTVVYLVYDPNDSFRSATRGHSSGNFKGIPCDVSQIRRLESQWYSVVFYTDTDWDHCTY